MFSLGEVALRPLRIDDIDTLYTWETDPELNILGGWTPSARLGPEAFRRKFERRIEEPEDDRVTFAIEWEARFVGYIELALIDRREARAAVGIVIGDRSAWRRGVGSGAVRILLDYGFTVMGLERIYAEVYDYNQASRRLFERVGFAHEGVLRQHEFHNGARQDTHVFGMLPAEFRARYPTLFPLPGAADRDADADS
jgi:diamine N-acetyltransferase